MLRPDRPSRTALPLLLAASFFCAPARADDTPQTKLEAVQKALEETRQQQQQSTQQATQLAAELAHLRPQEVAAAQAAQAHEAALTRLDTQLTALALQQHADDEELLRRRRETTQLVTALLHLARNPPSGIALAEGAPVDALRAGILLSAAVPPLIDRVNLLGIQLKTLADLHDQIREAEARHHIESIGLANEEARIRDLIALKTSLQQKASQDAAISGQQIEKLAAQAHDLKDLIERAEAEARRREAEEEKKRQERLAAAALPPPTVERGPGAEVQAAIPAPKLIDPTRPASIRPFSEARGRMFYPAAGAVVVGFGATEAAGVTSKGMTFETRAGCPGRGALRRPRRIRGPFQRLWPNLDHQSWRWLSFAAWRDSTGSTAASASGWSRANRSDSCLPERRSRASISSCATMASRLIRCHGWRLAMQR